MTTSKSSLFHAGLFRKNNFVVYVQLKHLTSNTASSVIFKLWSTTFLPSKLTEICPDSSWWKLNKTIRMFNISVKYTKIVDFVLESSLNFQSFLLHFMSFNNYRKSKTIFKSSFNSIIFGLISNNSQFKEGQRSTPVLWTTCHS